ncbi:hypothetical protein C8R48DRAFT_773068 [Suillus tomentosus]|nr:hypothetical protein C8R48DRAFT_773068 [Suillus tomentosus]
MSYIQKFTRVTSQIPLNEFEVLAPGEKGMMKHYQCIVTEIMQGLTSDELKEAKVTALAWSQEGPPADIQTNIAKTKGESLMKHFAIKMYRQAGMRIFVVLAWKEQDRKLMIGGRVQKVMHDLNDEIGSGERFIDTKDWQVILEEWNPYAEEQFNMQEGTDNHMIRGKTRQVQQLFHFELDNEGMPIIPNNQDLDLQTKKDLICDYMTKPKVPIPWATIIFQQEEFIKSKYLPQATRIKDPSKLKKAEAQMLLQFWRQRQKHTTDTTFEFKAWVDSDGHIHSPVRKPTQRAMTTGDQKTDEESSENDDDACLPPCQKSKWLAKQRATTGSHRNSPIGPVVDIDSQSSLNAGWKGNAQVKARVTSISHRKEPESNDSIQPRPLLRTCSRVKSEGLGFSSCAAPLTQVRAPNSRGLSNNVWRASGDVQSLMSDVREFQQTFRNKR